MLTHAPAAWPLVTRCGKVSMKMSDQIRSFTREKRIVFTVSSSSRDQAGGDGDECSDLHDDSAGTRGAL